MRGSLKLFSWFKIPVYLHWSFSLLVLFLLYMLIGEGELSMEVVVWQLILFVALFASVLFHEFGHALMARKYGVHTQDIILTPIGGIARLERMPEQPKQELWVAIAGPMVNVVIAILLAIIARLVVYSGDIEWFFFKAFVENWLSLDSNDTDLVMLLQDTDIQFSEAKLTLPRLMAVNLMMVLFNLIPAFPMDGGRILRALLAMQLGRSKATRAASIIGQVIAVVFVVLGLYYSAFTLTLIGFFVFTTARSENSMVQLEHLLGDFKALDVQRMQFTRLRGNDWMHTAIEQMARGLERNFLVFDLEDQLLGVLKEEEILKAAKRKDTSSEIRNHLRVPVDIVHERESLKYVHYLISQKNTGIVAVVDDQMQLTGVIDAAGLQNFFKIRS
jgi:Zn-dependent protease